jgi:HSP20 family molecular chaperone IbpA
MTDTDTKELQPQEKMEVAAPAESTRPGLVFTPAVDIFETDKEITLLADIPGVKAADLNIDLRDDTLTLTGTVAPFEGPQEEDILIEYEIGTYSRQFSLSEVIDQGKIDAQLTDGVLRLSLPKVEKATPRKITVKAG